MLPQGYEQANCCARNNVFVRQGSICQFGQIGSNLPKNLAYFDVDKLEKATLAQEYEPVQEEINRVFASYDTPMHNYQYLDQLCLSLLFHIALWGLRYGVSMEETLRTLGTTYAEIFQCDTLDSKRNFMLAVLFAYQKALGNRREQGHIANSVAMRVKEYVDKEFCANTISLDSIAAHVHKTPAYISRVFKNELGCNFSDYLTEKRMRVAAQLLHNPNNRVYAIAEHCGYADASNFIRVFKKYYGISPAEYRAVQGANA